MKIYQNQNIEVPEVTGLDYQNAANKLKEAKLNYVKEEKLTTDKDEEGIVLKQSKKAGSKTSEKTLIKLTVGVYDDTVVMPKVTSLKVDQALEKLNKLGIKYQIIYKETSDNFGIVLKQSINSDKKISKNTVVTLTITKQKAEENKDNQNQESNLEEKNENENRHEKRHRRRRNPQRHTVDDRRPIGFGHGHGDKIRNGLYGYCGQ